jgi:uncharacterized protein (DUF362 family)
MNVTHEGSMKIYRELASNLTQEHKVPLKSQRPDPYKINHKNQVAIIRTDNRKEGIIEAFKLLGGLSLLSNGVDGEIIIKPNCNTDDVYPRDTHPETVKLIAQLLIETGVKPHQIVVGDMSGRARGLPTRATMENLGIKSIAEEMGLQLSYFEEEPWVRLYPPEADFWPDGISIPQRIYNADRVIFTPILRSHTTATFTCALKLGVGLIDAAARNWLHNGEWHYEKLAQMNMAWNVDMVLSDAMQINTGKSTDPRDQVDPGIIIASNNLAANDAVAVALMRYYDTAQLKELTTKKHKQLQLAKKYGLGDPDLSSISLKISNMMHDPDFKDLISLITSELDCACTSV